MSEPVPNDLIETQRVTIARWERMIGEAEGAKNTSWQTQKSIADLRLSLKVLTTQLGELERQGQRQIR